MSFGRALVLLALVGGSGAAATAEEAAPVGAAEAKAPAPGAMAVAVTQGVEGEDVRGFRAFCDTWMQKLAARTAHNASHIAWTKGSGGVVGDYVSYGTARTCVAKEEPGKDPIGRITYREITHRKEGATEAVAQSAAGTIVEQTDVTEIFRFAKGRWQY